MLVWASFIITTVNGQIKSWDFRFYWSILVVVSVPMAKLSEAHSGLRLLRFAQLLACNTNSKDTRKIEIIRRADNRRSCRGISLIRFSINRCSWDSSDWERQRRWFITITDDWSDWLVMSYFDEASIDEREVIPASWLASAAIMDIRCALSTFSLLILKSSAIYWDSESGGLSALDLARWATKGAS